MKKISSKELNELSINQKLDMIMHALGIVSESGVFVSGSVINGHKLAASGLKEDKISPGLSEDVYAMILEKLFGEKKKDADAASRLEAASDAVCNLAAKSSRVMIFTGKDIRELLEDLLEKFKDDPEAVAVIKKALEDLSS